jgi:hypothetical protein
MGMAEKGSGTTEALDVRQLLGLGGRYRRTSE